MATNLGWKITRVDGTTYNGFEWPSGTPESPATLEAPEAREGDVCPSFEGDGFCVALTMEGACSGGLSLASSQALWLAYEDEDVLGYDDTKVRVRRVQVVGRFDPIAALRRGASGVNLRGVNLRDADLSGVNLYGWERGEDGYARRIEASDTRERTYQQSEAPEVLTVTGQRNGRSFTVTIKVREIVLRTTGEAEWRKGSRVEPYHGNIACKMQPERS